MSVRDQSKVPSGYLWKKEDRNGKPYLGGVISLGIFGEVPIVIFEEEPQEGRTGGPDYVIRNATHER